MRRASAFLGAALLAGCAAPLTGPGEFVEAFDEDGRAYVAMPRAGLTWVGATWPLDEPAVAATLLELEEEAGGGRRLAVANAPLQVDPRGPLPARGVRQVALIEERGPWIVHLAGAGRRPDRLRLAEAERRELLSVRVPGARSAGEEGGAARVPLERITLDVLRPGPFLFEAVGAVVSLGLETEEGAVAFPATAFGSDAGRPGYLLVEVLEPGTYVVDVATFRPPSDAAIRLRVVTPRGE